MEWCDPDGYCMVALRLNARQGKTDLRWFTDISNRLCWLHDVEICIYRWYWSELWKQASEMLLFNSHPPRPSPFAPSQSCQWRSHREAWSQWKFQIGDKELCRAVAASLSGTLHHLATISGYHGCKSCKLPTKTSLSLYIYALYMHSIPHIFPTCFSWQKIHQYFWILLAFWKWHPYSAVTR